MKSTLKLTIELLALLFALVVVPLALAQEDGGTISYGETVTGEITNEVSEIRYTFNGTAGDTIIIRMTATPEGLDSYVNLYDPMGSLIISDDDSAGNYNSLLGPQTLAETGSYSIGASRCCGVGQIDASQGTFTLTLEKLELPPLTLGETVSVDLVDNEQAFYSIPAGADSVYSIQATVLEGNDSFYLSVHPAATGLTNQGYGNNLSPAMIDPLFLNGGPATVTLQLEQRYGPDGAIEETGRSLRVGVTLNVAEVQPIAVGSSASGVLNDENPSDHYQFESSASQILRLSGEMPAGDQSFEISIMDSNGQMFSGANTEMIAAGGNSFVVDPIQLPFDGTFMILVRRLQYDTTVPMNTTNYTISLSETETPLLEAGVEVLDSVSEGAYEKVYRLNVTEGQRIVMVLRSVDTTYSPYINITGPNQAVSEVPNGPGTGGGYGGGGGYFDNFVFSGNGAKAGVITYEWVADSTGVYLFRVNVYYGPQGINGGQFGLKVDVR